MQLETYQLEAFPSVAIIGLHGWTGNEKSLLPVARGVRCHSARWYLPRGPYPASNGIGFSWAAGHDRKAWEMARSRELIDGLIKQIKNDGFELNDVFLLGFSMGAGFALELALTSPQDWAGVIAIAGFLRNPDVQVSKLVNSDQATPVLLLHGENDDIVPVEDSRTALRFLRERNYPVALTEYSAGHKVPVNKYQLIRGFINNPVFPEQI